MHIGVVVFNKASVEHINSRVLLEFGELAFTRNDSIRTDLTQILYWGKNYSEIPERGWSYANITLITILVSNTNISTATMMQKIVNLYRSPPGYETNTLSAYQKFNKDQAY